MNSYPDTRASLLLRVRNPADHEAWCEFCEIYRPIVLRLAKRKGLQPSDAEDVAQQVMLSVARAIEKRPHDLARAKFRTWLHRVAHNGILNALTRAKPDRGVGDTDHVFFLESQVARGPDSGLVELECRREIFRRAAERVRGEFAESTWQAFWRTAICGEEGATVATDLDKSRGAVYAARCRVMRRLSEEIEASGWQPNAAAWE